MLLFCLLVLKNLFLTLQVQPLNHFLVRHFLRFFFFLQFTRMARFIGGKASKNMEDYSSDSSFHDYKKALFFYISLWKTSEIYESTFHLAFMLT